MVIDENAVKCGTMSLREAVNFAEGRGYDLVEVSNENNVSICKLMNFGKYRYNLQRKMRSSGKTKAKGLKEVKMGINIAEHDLEIKIRSIIKFITTGHQVKVQINMKGREVTHPEIPINIMKTIEEGVKDAGTLKEQAVLFNNNMTGIFVKKATK